MSALLSRRGLAIGSVALVVGSGCGSSGPERASGSGTAAGAVTGTAIDTFEPNAETSTMVPVSPTYWSSISAVVGAGAAAQAYPGTLDASGMLSIPGVPSGTYALTLETPAPYLPSAASSLTIIETASRTLDLGHVMSYRQGRVPLAKPSLITLNASLTLPWQGDLLSLYSRSTANMSVFSTQGQQTAPMSAPALGAMSIAGWQIDAGDFNTSRGGYGPFALTPADDLLFLHDVVTPVVDPTQPPTSPWASYVYDAAREALVAAPITLADGGAATMQGAFQALPQKTFAFQVNDAAFAPALADAPDQAAIADGSWGIGIANEPGTPAPAIGNGALLLEVDTQGAAVGTHAHTFSYGNPFDYGQELATFGVTLYTEVSALMPYARYLVCYLSITTSASSMSGTTIVPLLGLPRKVTVNGAPAPATKVTTGVGATPVVAWEAPTIGTAEGYQVYVNRLDEISPSGGVAYSQWVFTMHTTATSVTIPAGVLQTGWHYSVAVVAMHGGFDPEHVFALTAETYTSQTFTGILMP